jgi:hypothetical protein
LPLQVEFIELSRLDDLDSEVYFLLDFLFFVVQLIGDILKNIDDFFEGRTQVVTHFGEASFN